MAELIYAAEAKLEIKEAAKYYEGCKEKLGHAFLKEVDFGDSESSSKSSTMAQDQRPVPAMLAKKISLRYYLFY